MVEGAPGRDNVQKAAASRVIAVGESIEMVTSVSLTDIDRRFGEVVAENDARHFQLSTHGLF